MNEKNKKMKDWLLFIINNHDILQLEITHKKEKLNIEKAEQLLQSIFVLITKLYDQKLTKVDKLFMKIFDKEDPFKLREVRFLLEILRDLRTSIHLAEFAYYKAANGQIRNVLENLYRFLYYNQFPERLNKFTDKKYSLEKKDKEKINFKNVELKEKLENYPNKLSKYVHSAPMSLTKIVTGYNAYRENLFGEWIKNFEETCNLTKETLESF